MNIIQELFKDRTGIITEDCMYPRKIQHKTPKDLLSLFFTHGECTSFVVDGETFNMAVYNGNALFSPSHTFAWSRMETFANILSAAPTLSFYSFEQSLHMLWRFCSIPDMLITSGDGVMLQKAREIQQYFEVKRGWKIEHVVCPQLVGLPLKWRWFVADSRKATGHYKKLTMGFSEICVFTPDWIVASLSVTQPTL